MSARKTHKVRFIVKGAGPFPIDMLRYDCCYPEHESDSAAIAQAGRGERVTVNVIKNVTGPAGIYKSEPTVGRWESFGWLVVGVERVS